MNFIGPITGDKELDTYLFYLRNTIEDLLYKLNQQEKSSYSGTFVAGTKTITVVNGLITNVV